MSMLHKAYELDWLAFERIRPAIERALTLNDPTELMSSIEADLNGFRDPYAGQLLAPDWRDSLETGGVQEIADFALTQCYDPSRYFGLKHDWMRIEEGLSPEGRGALLGIAIGPAANLFDPGGMGSYFQTPHEVARSLKVLREVPQLQEYCQGLVQAANNSRGLYVTF
jgi:hypothetical protein